MRTIRNISCVLFVATCWCFLGSSAYSASMYCDWLGDNRMLYGDTGPTGSMTSGQADDYCYGVETVAMYCSGFCQLTEDCYYDSNQLTGSCSKHLQSNGQYSVTLTCTCALGAGG